MEIDPQSLWSDIQTIRKFSPLIHNITNYVVMEQTANSLLAIGASPVMAHALEEVEEMAMKASSLVLNMGTLSSSWVEAMLLALKMANHRGIPIAFDPVGVGATPYRTQTAKSILNHGTITVIRGNASEIVALNGDHNQIKGVDSLLDPSNYVEKAKAVANENRCIVSMSGETDVVTNGESVFFVHNGHPLMTKVTGMGCTATALIGAFLSINPDPLLSSVHAAILMGIVGEIAAENSNGPGSFKASFADILYTVSLNAIKKRMRVETL
ncbi:MAG: hydroxyethylthiazole kinase [Chlamydiales bacterium]